MHKKPRLLAAIGIIVALLFEGCVAPFSREVRSHVNKDLTFERLLIDPESHRGESMLVGGRILETVPQEKRTELIVLQQPLSFDYAPIEGDRTSGRFLLIINGFLDPAVYAPGRKITVAAEVAGVQTRKVGEKQYTYPVLRALEIRLWPSPEEALDYYYPGAPYYGPYGDPYRGPYWGPYWEPYWPSPYQW